MVQILPKKKVWWFLKLQKEGTTWYDLATYIQEFSKATEKKQKNTGVNPYDIE